MKIGVVSLLVTPSIPLGEFVLLVPSTLGSVGVEVLVLRQGCFNVGIIVRPNKVKSTAAATSL